MRRSRGICLLLATAATAWSAVVPTQAGIIYNRGHGDIALKFHDGELELHYHFDSSSRKEVAGGGLTPIVTAPDFEDEFAPNEVFVRVADPPAFRPAGAQWDFIGTPEGGNFWFLPQNNDAAKPFLGIASDELDVADWIGGITWALTGINMPTGGQFALFQSGFGSPVRFWDTQDGSFANDVFTSSVGGHDHFFYSFTTTGVYELEITASGNHRIFGEVSDTATFTFLVGDSTAAPDPAAVPEPSTVALLSVASVLGVGRRVWRKKKHIAADTAM